MNVFSCGLPHVELTPTSGAHVDDVMAALLSGKALTLGILSDRWPLHYPRFSQTYCTSLPCFYPEVRQDQTNLMVHYQLIYMC